ncbi:FBP domain-containing protein [Mycolicibacterium sp. 018/SC-01/001]|uniref:FBP domain-containing protein n=1 Tax=Mycolicibacterium sp. 018/SC-01/001 TaxID=2592069 RepID=UPI00117E75AF|nr:FBP domain-containing protein [Mycolicibacterium sp. 018/SC-01/001]TRW84721.1 FBP domain-containing protein [Mycolicibacterium sp. 018/SC-01/001]
MHAFTRDHILGAFRGATRGEIKKVTFPPDFDTVDFESLDYYGWSDPKLPRRAYLVVEHLDGPVALLLNRAASKPRGRAMCTWCNDVTLTEDAVLYAVRRAGAAGRKGDTVGALICADFGCSKNVRRLPPAFHKGTDLDLIRARQVDELRRKVQGFVDRVLATTDD